MSRRVWTRRMSTLCFAATVGLLATGYCGLAHAAELWYDGFDLTEYTAGSALGGQSGGTGTFFTGAWKAQNGVDPGTLVIADSTSRLDQISPSIGGSASTDSPEGCCTTQRTAREFAEPWGGFTNPDGTFYMGFLTDFGTGVVNDPQHRVIEFWGGWDPDNPDANRNLLLGLSSFVGEVGSNLALAVQDSNTGTWARADLLVDGGSISLGNLAFQGTHFMVLKFEMSNSGDDVVSAFLDPVGTTEPAPNASLAVGEFLADHMSAFVQFVFNAGGAGVNGVLDELRVGTTFADVANNALPFVVPEPASLVLSVLGMLGVLLTGRGRRA